MRWVDLERALSTQEGDRHALDKYHSPGLHHDFWRCVQKFIGRAWFQRIWIIQEYALARRPALMIGRFLLHGPWLRLCVSAMHHRNTLLRETDMITFKQLNMADDLAYLQSVHNVVILWQVQTMVPESPTSLSLCTLLELSRQFPATDCRDFLYSVQGIATRVGLLTLHVDYSESADALGSRLTTFLLGKESGGYALYRCRGISRS